MNSPSSYVCRSCGSAKFYPVLSLGKTPLANALLSKEQLGAGEAKYPLDLVLCTDCTLVQITETVPPEILFKNYFYFSSFSDSMLDHARRLVKNLINDRSLGKKSLVVEIASNDGYLLQFFKQEGVPVLGIEPATNIASCAIERGIHTINEFFSEALAKRICQEGYQADVIVGNNVLAHVADLHGLVEGVKILLKDDGVGQFEFPYLKDFIDHNEFDTIYHEHLCYFSLTAVDKLFCQHGFRTVSVERVPIHGGSLRVRFALHDSNVLAEPSVGLLLSEEQKWGVGRVEFYADFAKRVDLLGEKLRKLLGQLKSQGKRIAAYGAAAKGSTLLNYFGIGAEFLDFVVDRSTHKQGRFMPGVHLPILPTHELLKQMPDYTVVLPWNFAEEILKQQNEYYLRGGRFIIPVPDVRVV